MSLQVGMPEPPSTVSVVTARDGASCWNPGYDKGAWIYGYTNGSFP